MPVIPSQSGFFWGALGQALQGLPSQAMQYQKMQNEQKAQDLRAKMLGLQAEELQQKLAVQQRQNDALSGIQGLYDKGVTEPTQIGGPVQGPYTESGQPPAPPPPTTTRPAELKDMQRYLPALAPSQFVTGAMRTINPTMGAQGMTLDQYRQFSQSPEFQQMFPQGATPDITTRGVTIRGMNPVSAANSVYHDVLTKTGDPRLAWAAYQNKMNELNATNKAAGVAGEAAQKLGEPIQRPQPFADQPQQMPAPTPGPSSRTTPNPVEGTYPTSQAPSGLSPALRAKQAESAAGAQGRETVTAQKNLLGLGGLQITLDRIKTLSERVPAPQPGADRAVTGLKNYMDTWTQANPDTAELDSMRSAYANILNRSLLAEKGVITDRDREYAKNIVPGIWDTAEMRQRNIRKLQAFTDALVWGETQLANGRLDPGAFRAKLDQVEATIDTNGKPGQGRLIPLSGK